MTQLDSVSVSDPPREALSLIRDANKIVVMAHVSPDADAIGSVLGLTTGLAGLGKTVLPVLSDRIPDYARFLAGTDAIVSTLPEDRFDLHVIADAAGIDRVGDLYSTNPSVFETVPSINMDHHRTNPLFGTVNYVDPKASSTSELSYRLLTALGAPIGVDAATALLFGIMGDTGSFRNGATTPGSLEVAGNLVAIGADSQAIAFQLFERKTFGAARLWGRILGTIELDAARRIVFSCVSQRMLAEENATVDETEGVVEHLRGIIEATVVVLLKETENGEIRVSLRSRPEVDVSQIASSLGGGGHRQAAGCTIPGTFADAKRVLTEAFDRLA